MVARIQKATRVYSGGYSGLLLFFKILTVDFDIVQGEDK